MTKSQEQARQNLVEIVGYFKMVAKDWNWYSWRKSEYEVVFAVANIISTKNLFDENDFVSTAACVNQIVEQEHANGSGWFDFQLRLSSFFYAFGYESDWDSGTREFIFWKR